jgi:hypothetical protein
MALLAIGTEHVARGANRNGVVQWKSGDPVHFFSIQVGLLACPSDQHQSDRIPPLTTPFRESHFICSAFQGTLCLPMHSAPSAEGGCIEEGAETKWLFVFGRKRKQDPRLDVQLASHSSDWTARSQEKAGRHSRPVQNGGCCGTCSPRLATGH